MDYGTVPVASSCVRLRYGTHCIDCDATCMALDVERGCHAKPLARVSARSCTCAYGEALQSKVHCWYRSSHCASTERGKNIKMWSLQFKLNFDPRKWRFHAEVRQRICHTMHKERRHAHGEDAVSLHSRVLQDKEHPDMHQYHVAKESDACGRVGCQDPVSDTTPMETRLHKSTVFSERIKHASEIQNRELNERMKSAALW
eukprot:5149500-Amphidinium_carterae.2